MKKLLVLLFSLFMAVSLVGCSEDDDFDSYEYEGDDRIEVQEDDDDREYDRDDDDEEYDDD
jgi:uncharacterized lipoprotein YehR (DUF1307 family)